MLNFEKLAEVLEGLRAKPKITIQDVDNTLSPIAANTHAYMIDAEARIQTYERAIVLQTFGDETLEDFLVDDGNEQDNDD